MPTDSDSSVLPGLCLKPDDPLDQHSKHPQKPSKPFLRSNGEYVNGATASFKTRMRVRSEKMFNEVKSDAESTRRHLLKKSYKMAARFLCDPSAASYFPRRFGQDQYPFEEQDPSFDFWDEMSHVIEKNEAGLTEYSSLEAHDPYVLTRDELDFIEAVETPEPVSKDNNKFQSRIKTVEDEFAPGGTFAESILGWDTRVPEKIAGYKEKKVFSPWHYKNDPASGGYIKKLYRVWVNNPAFDKSSINRNRYVHPNNRKLTRRVNFAQRNVLRNELIPEAHRIMAMLTIKADPNRKTVVEAKIDSKTINGERVGVWTPDQTRMIPSSNDFKSYLKDKVNLFYKVFSELDTGLPFNQIPNSDCVQFIAAYEDQRYEGNEIVWTMPHVHILILDNCTPLLDPDRLAVFLQRLSGRKSRQFRLPRIHLRFLSGGNAHLEYLKSIHIPKPPPDFSPLREQRIHTARYISKFVWLDEDADDDWKIMNSRDFQKEYFRQSEEQAIENAKAETKNKWKRKRAKKAKVKSINSFIEQENPNATST